MAADRQSTTTDRIGRNPVLVAALIIYGTLFLLLVTMPGSVLGWLQGLNSNVLQERALRVAEVVQAVSDRIGLSVPYLRAREAFLKERQDQ